MTSEIKRVLAFLMKVTYVNWKLRENFASRQHGFKEWIRLDMFIMMAEEGKGYGGIFVFLYFGV